MRNPMQGTLEVGKLHGLAQFARAGLLLLMLGLTSAACGDDSGAAQDDGSVEQDGGEEDAGEEWTYECPTDIPEGHYCLRGRVLDIVTDEPVQLAESLHIKRKIWGPPECHNFAYLIPEEAAGESTVRADGRFNFGVVEYSPDCTLPPHPMDLDIEESIEGYHVPTNRYIMMYEDHYELNFYVVPTWAGDTWEGATLQEWCYGPGNIAVDVGAPFKTVLGVCYGANPVGSRVYPQQGLESYLLSVGDLWCSRALSVGRTAFVENYDEQYLEANSSGIGFLYAFDEARIYPDCRYPSGESVEYAGGWTPEYFLVGAGYDKCKTIVVFHSPL